VSFGHVPMEIATGYATPFECGIRQLGQRIELCGCRKVIGAIL
jgi:hypothetical protein